jgi:hypothetical protein
MVNNLKKSILVLGVIGLLAISTSCGKKENDATEVASIASDDNAADNSFADLKDAVDQVGITITTKANEKLNDNCIKVTKSYSDSITKNIKLDIDFGKTDCVCKDNKTRRGKITIEYIGAAGATGSEVVYTPEKYFVNSYGVSGIKSIKIIDKWKDSIKVENGKITKPDGGIITWKSDRTRKMVAGEDTPLFLDDAYEIEGTSSGTNSVGKTYTFATKTPLLKSLGCQWIKSGKLEIQREGKKDAVIDYGNGTCDDKATLNVGSWTKEIKAKKW